jgi:tetratricopeptide (TPR) repeat protein
MTRIGVGTIVSLALCLLSGVSSADPQRRLESGRKALESGDSKRAAKDFAQGLEEAREDGAPAGVLLNLNLALADVYATWPDLGREADAEPLFLEARRIAEQGAAPGHGARIEVLRRLGGYYAQQGKPAQAIPVLEQFLKEAETAAPPDRLYASEEASMLREAYSAVGNSEGAARMRKLAEDPAARRELAGGKVAEIPREKLYVEPNATAADGTPIFVHVDPNVIPLRVSVATPETPASDGSPEETRKAAIDGMREWEIAIQRLRPDFRIDFEHDVASAPIQVTWSDRPPGYTGGVGTVRAETVDGTTRALGRVILSAKPLPGRGETLTLGQVYANAVHAFGGALGLGYCQDCDSVRSMGWKQREGAMRPTDLDLRTLEALLAREVGERAGDRPASEGVLADLRFVNTGDDRHICVDIAKPGAAPFVVQLDTGASETVMSPLYARALGVATRAVKSDQHRRDSITGKPVLFWVTDQFEGARDTTWSYALLGGSYLESYVLEVDVSGRRARLLDPDVHRVGGEKGARPAEQVVGITVTHGWPLVNVRLGNGTTTALIDTGSMGGEPVGGGGGAARHRRRRERAAAPVAERAGHVGRGSAALAGACASGR